MSSKYRFGFWLVFLAFFGFTESSAAQSPTPTPSPPPPIHFAKRIVHDQKIIWLSPFHLKHRDLKLVAPIVVGAAALVYADRHTSGWVDRNGSLPAVSRDISLAGSVYSTGGIAAGLYLIGHSTGNRHLEETGRLATEALIDTGIVTQVLKFGTGRTRPDVGAGRGHFFQGGRSFPSGHTSSSWALATIIACEYRSHPLIKYGAIAAAIAVSLSRYSGRNHFLSDIAAGGALGFGIGRFVFQNR